MSLVQVHALLDACDRRCPSCLHPFEHHTRPFCIDHEHRSGLVRGLQCPNCNYVIGTFHDNQGWFERVGAYLLDPPAPHIIGNIYVPGSPGAAGVFL